MDESGCRFLDLREYDPEDGSVVWYRNWLKHENEDAEDGYARDWMPTWEGKGWDVVDVRGELRSNLLGYTG